MENCLNINVFSLMSSPLSVLLQMCSWDTAQVWKHIHSHAEEAGKCLPPGSLCRQSCICTGLTARWTEG